MLRKLISGAAILLSVLVWAGTAQASLPHRPFTYATELDQSREALCIARAIYWEARAGSPAGRIAVAQVILNRAADPRWPSDPCAVVYQKVGARCQFSWVCTSLRNREPGDPALWRLSLKAAGQALRGMPDLTGRALYFHASYVSPGWHHLQRVARIDNHIFYAERTR